MPSVRLFIVPCPSARPNALSTRSATREEVSTLPAATAAPGRRVEQAARGRAHLDRPVGAGRRRDVGVGQHAHREQARRARDRQRAVEVALVLSARCRRSRASAARPRTSPSDAARRSPSGASSTSSAFAHAVGRAPPGTRACAARSSRAPRPSPRAAARAPSRAASSASRSAPMRLAASCARRSARRSSRLAHARDELARSSPRRAGAARSPRPPRPGVRLSAGIEPGTSPAHIGVVGAAGREADQLRSTRTPGVITVMSGRWVPPANGSLRTHETPGACSLAEHGRHRGGHRAEVHGNVLGLHDHLAVRVEQRGRSVAALLDVRRVRRADQHHAHLLAGGAQRARRAPAARSGPARSAPPAP